MRPRDFVDGVDDFAEDDADDATDVGIFDSCPSACIAAAADRRSESYPDSDFGRAHRCCKDFEMRIVRQAIGTVRACHWYMCFFRH